MGTSQHLLGARVRCLINFKIKTTPLYQATKMGKRLSAFSRESKDYFKSKGENTLLRKEATNIPPKKKTTIDY